jgi:hypothetical protein
MLPMDTSEPSSPSPSETWEPSSPSPSETWEPSSPSPSETWEPSSPSPSEPDVSATLEPSTSPIAVEFVVVSSSSTYAPLSSRSSELFVELDAEVEDITPSMVDALKEFIAASMVGIQASQVRIEMFAGSVVFRISFITTAPEPITPNAMDTLLQAIKSPELQTVLPIGTVADVSTTLGGWSDWFSSAPNSTGDEELVDSVLRANPSLCEGSRPSAIHCQTVQGVSWRETNETLQISCSLAGGGIRCLNIDNPGGCSDYRLRLKCPRAVSTAKPTVAPAARQTDTPTSPSTTPNCERVCSGHGSCSGKLTNECRCDNGWLPPNCSESSIAIAITADTDECQGSTVRLPLPSIVPGDQYAQCLLNRSRWTTKSFALVRLKVQPTAPVTCRLRTNRSDEVQLSLTQVTLQPNQLETQIPIFGIIDGKEDGPQPFALSVTCSSQDGRYDAAEHAATAVNEDVPSFRIQRMTPVSGTVPYAGVQVTIEGVNFDYPGLRVFVDAVEVTGPPVFRSILVNETAGRIFEVFFDDAEVQDWLSLADALVVHEAAARQPFPDGLAGADESLTQLGRRKPTGGNVVGGKGASTGSQSGTSGFDGPGVTSNWYEQILLAQQNESWANQSATFEWPSDLENAPGLNATEANFSTTQFRIGAVVAPGTLRNRIVLAWARLQVSENESFYVAREYVQPHNFSLESETRLSFVTPPREGKGLIAGFAEVRISTMDGPEVLRDLSESSNKARLWRLGVLPSLRRVWLDDAVLNPRAASACMLLHGPLGMCASRRVMCGQTILNASLYITDTCHYRGWFGSGASCRPCPVGGYCPGGDRVWPLPGYGL